MSLDGKHGKKAIHLITDQRDNNLNGQWWKSDDIAQKQFLVSILEKMTGRVEHPDWNIIEVPATALVYMPHKYYTINTRDGTPATGRIVMGQDIEGI